MKSVVALLAVLVAASATKRYGCLYEPSACTMPEFYCHNDGFSGHCISVPAEMRLEKYLSHGDFQDNRALQLDKFASSTRHDNIKVSETSYKKLLPIVHEVQQFLHRHGYTFSKLTKVQQEKVYSVIAKFVSKRMQKAKQEAKMKHLIGIIIKTRDQLLMRGIRLEQLNDQQLDDLSTAIIQMYLRDETNEENFPSNQRHNNNLMEEEAIDTISPPGIKDKEDEGKETVQAPEDESKETVQAPEDESKETVLSTNEENKKPAQPQNIKTQTENAKKEFAKKDTDENYQEIGGREGTKTEKKLKTGSIEASENQPSIESVKVDTADGRSNFVLDEIGMSEVAKKKVQQEDVYIIIVVVVVVAVVFIIAICTVCYCMKSIERRRKLLGASSVQSDDDDYQELCRQHYASKAAEQKDLSTQSLKQDAGRHESTASTPTLVFSPVAQQRKRNSQAKASRTSSLSSWSEEPVTTTLDISTGHAVLSYMEGHMKNKDRLSEEWTSLCKYQADNDKCEVGRDNLIRNRFHHIVPYDHNRVRLGVEGVGANTSDYINASFIIDNDPRQPVYIATQGPLSSTIHHFWQMIWEQKSVAIVMLTPVTEDGASQCARYWPDEGSSIYNNYEIHLVSEHIWCEDYLVRSLYLKNLKTCETRTVTQFHFLSWPRNGIPFSPKPLLELRRKVSKCYRGSNSPVVVHCSDGVGRTGTYILIDLAITRMLKGVKEMDIAATLEHLRDQRMGMVASQEQLEFALGSVAEEVNAILKVLLH